MIQVILLPLTTDRLHLFQIEQSNIAKLSKVLSKTAKMKIHCILRFHMEI